jgi:hypothetical protein
MQSDAGLRLGGLGGLFRLVPLDILLEDNYSHLE